MATDQEALTVIAEIKPQERVNLGAVLEHIGQDVKNNGVIPFPKLKTIHFARWVILDEAKDGTGRPIPAQLVFSTNYDAPLGDHLAELADVAGSGLDRIFSHCEGYLAHGPDIKGNVRRFLEDHTIPTRRFTSAPVAAP